MDRGGNGRRMGWLAWSWIPCGIAGGVICKLNRRSKAHGAIHRVLGSFGGMTTRLAGLRHAPGACGGFRSWRSFRLKGKSFGATATSRKERLWAGNPPLVQPDPDKAIAAMVRALPRIGTIATMASRFDTFSLVLPRIYEQVDHLYVFLDGYAESPAILNGYERVSVFHAKEHRNLHASSRYLCLRHIPGPSVILPVDDDIAYPCNYVARMVEALARWDGRALVGVHGRIFRPPYTSFVRNAECLHFARSLESARPVHLVGSGTSAFISDQLDVDPCAWPYANMDDLFMAIEASRRSLPRIAIERPENWLVPYAEGQSDSIWRQTLKNDQPQTQWMRTLLEMDGLIT